MSGFIGFSQKRNGVINQFTSQGIDDNADANAITIASDESVTLSGDLVPSSALSHRNMVINGAFLIAQRATSIASVGTSDYKTVDRFKQRSNGLDNVGGGSGLVQSQNSVTDLAGFNTSFKLYFNTAETSVEANEFLHIRHVVEAQNASHLSYGIAGAKTMTLSFYVKSNVNGTYAVSIQQPDSSNRLIGTTYTVGDADWQRVEWTIPGDASGTINNNNGAGLYIDFWLAAGADYTGGSTNTSWTAHATNKEAYGHTANTLSAGMGWEITGVQLELGSNATPFEHRSFAEELTRCQRYYQRYGSPKTFDAGTYYYNSTIFMWCLPMDNDDVLGSHILPVEMRTSPTPTITDALIRLSNNANNFTSGNSLQEEFCSSTHVILHIDLTTTALDVNNMIALSFQSTAGYYDLSAEL